MTRCLTRLLLFVYPREWRERYGPEFEELLLSEPGGLRNAVDILMAAVRERARGSALPNESHWSIGMIATRISAFLPILMSLTALSAVICHVLLYGTAREADEGAVAHIWQILMAGQLPLLMVFMVRWVPRAPRQALCILAAQAGAALASMAPVLLLGL